MLRVLSSIPGNKDFSHAFSVLATVDSTTTTPTGKTFNKKDFSADNKTVIARILGLSEQDVLRPPKKMVVENLATQVWKVLQNHGFTAGEVIRHPDLFMISPWATENYIQIMNESCFREVELSKILHFTTIHKQTLQTLHDKNVTPPTSDIVRSYFQVLEIQRNTKAEDCVWNALPRDMNRLSLADLRRIVVSQYMAWKLDVRLAKVETSILKYPRMNYRCLSWIKKSLLLLMNELQFDSEKILKHVYILTGNPENSADIVRTMDSLSGMPLRQLLNSRPKILMSQKSSLLEIEKLFKTHEISTESLLKHPELFTLAPTTVRERLEEFDTVPEFRPLKKHPRVSRLIYYQKKAKQRVEYFRVKNITGVSLHLLSSDKKRFKRHMEQGDARTRGLDMLTFLKESLQLPNMTVKEIRENIMRHPHWLHISAVNAKDSLQYIRSLNVFNNEQIFSALPIVLYPKEKIEQEFQNVLDTQEAKLTDPYFLHMVLYFLERVVHFSGDGVWHNNVQPNVDEELKSSVMDAVEEGKRNNKGTSGDLVEHDEDIVFGDSLEDTLKGNNNGKKRRQD